MNNLGRVLKHIRVFGHCTQYELATKLELNRSYISEMENGKKTPSQEVLTKYSEFADVPLSAILFFAENYEDKPTLRKKAKYLVCKSALGLLDWICRE